MNACRAYGALLYAYPKEFRSRFGSEMQQVFRDRWRAACAGRNRAPFRFFLSAARDWVESVSKERMASMSAAWNNRLWRAVRGVSVAVSMLVVCLIVTAPFLHAYVISSTSMQDSLQVGDYLLVHKLGHNSEINRGDLVTFRYPVDPRQTFVKRVIGVPGDHIRIEGKQVIRNGRRLIEPYVEHVDPAMEPFRDNFPAVPTMALPAQGMDMLQHHVVAGAVVVPPGELFLLGDNRDESLDSRHSGFVPRENVIGEPLVVYWSYDRATGKTRWNRTLHMLRPEQAQEVTP